MRGLYLDPLRQRVKANGGSVYRRRQPFYLLIDLKSDAEPTYAALAKVLAEYADIFSVVHDGKVEPKAVQVVDLGQPSHGDHDGRERALCRHRRPHERSRLRRAGRPDAAGQRSLGHALQMAGRGPISDAERAKLADAVAKAHAHGRRIRFWATPETLDCGASLQAAGVDHINTDNLAGLEKFLCAASRTRTTRRNRRIHRWSIVRPANSGPLTIWSSGKTTCAAAIPSRANKLAPNSTKTKDEFRDYRADAKPEVAEFYRLNHRLSDGRLRARQAGRIPAARQAAKMGLWDGLEFLNTLVDDSDPDTSLPQIEHLLQTAEAIRRDGHPRWFVLTGLIHDFGKVLCLFGEPQWAVVGDTFPVGCA